MSSYFQALNKHNKKRYQRKLELSGISLKDDSYLPDRSSDWSADVDNWPKMTYGNIFSYFISKPCMYMLQLLTSWRQLEAYNYIKNNHVRTVFSLTCDNGRRVVLKAKVNPGFTGINNKGRQELSLPLVDTISTETVSSTSNGDSTCPPHSPAPTYYWCGGGESGRVITCDNLSCTVGWLHFMCIGLRHKPSGKWFYRYVFRFFHLVNFHAKNFRVK